MSAFLVALANVWAFVRSPLGLRLLLVLVVVSMIGAAYLTGRSDGVRAEKTAEAARLKKAEKVIVHREAVAQKITDHVAGDLVKTRVEIQYRTKTLIEKVPTYVTPADDAACVVPRGFVQLHDGAAAGLPAPAGRPDPTPSGVPLSAVAETVVANYGVAYDWRAEVMAWRTWYAEQKAAWDRK